VTELELFIDSIRRLNSAGTPYAVTGSMASNHWGIPRSTHDLDFVVQISESDDRGIANAFRDEFMVDEEMILSARQPPYHFNLIDSRSGLKLDFWMVKPEPFDREAFARRVRREVVGDQFAWLMTAEDIILSKLCWNQLSPSDKQVADVAGIVAVQADDLDCDYLRRWADELGIRLILEKLLAREIRPKVS
jgi:hypothetical protein